MFIVMFSLCVALCVRFLCVCWLLVELVRKKPKCRLTASQHSEGSFFSRLARSSPKRNMQMSVRQHTHTHTKTLSPTLVSTLFLLLRAACVHFCHVSARSEKERERESAKSLCCNCLTVAAHWLTLCVCLWVCVGGWLKITTLFVSKQQPECALFPAPCCCFLISQCCALLYTYINIDNERERERVQISGVMCRGACAFIQHKYKYKHGWVTAAIRGKSRRRVERQTGHNNRQRGSCLQKWTLHKHSEQQEKSARECVWERERETLLSSTYLSYTHKQRAHGFAVLILLCRWHSLTV